MRVAKRDSNRVYALIETGDGAPFEGGSAFSFTGKSLEKSELTPPRSCFTLLAMVVLLAAVELPLAVPGAVRADLDVTRSRAEITWDPGSTALSSIAGGTKPCNSRYRLIADSGAPSNASSPWWSTIARSHNSATVDIVCET